ESALGLHLLHRTTREVKVTQRGQQLYKDCAPLLESLAYSVDLAIDAEVSFKGKLTVSMPVRAGLDFLGNWLIDFASEHNELNLELSLSNVNLNLIKEDIDLAFRVGPLVDSSAVALRLWDIPYSLCASDAFVASHQLNPEHISLDELKHLPCVVSLPARSWSFMDNTKKEILFEPTENLVVDDLSLAYHAVKSGQFVAMIPSVMITEPTIVSLNVADLTPRQRTMYAYYMGKRHTISQIKHIVDYIKERNLKQNI
ncbi:LysR substrate-binding domain-containing protein, partial [Photobacterium sp. OFAV2-7]|uniref:LysR substrate-binding domain-containing protein n=1 Tax=Photobacterium sp. OFAV2-7 TaxID=2917748 RepID=UPI001EF54B2A